MENTIQTQNKMGTMPVFKLILNMSLPMMFSMLILALYNIVDSMFVAMINEDALTAISLAFPVQNLMTAFSIGTGVGVNALLSRRLGEKNQDAVNKVAMNGLFLSIVTSIIFIIAGYFFLPSYLKSQTTNADIVEYGLEYLHIIVYFCPIIFISVMSDKILQATGKTFYTMLGQIVGAVTNIVLDPMFIFGIGFFPKLGVYGAATATVIGQLGGLIVSVVANLKKNHEVQFKLKSFIPHLPTIGQIYKIGVPTIILNSVTSITTYFMNLILGAFSTTAIAVYGVYFKLNSFIFMPVFGLNNGIIPIIGYNYGAKNKQRITSAIKYSILIASVLMLFGTFIFEVFPKQLLAIFSASENMLAIGIPTLRVIATSFIGAAIAISLSSVFQAFGKAVYSMIVSLVRQIVVLLPVAYFLAKTGSITLLWLCFPIAELFSVGLSVIFMTHLNKTIIKKL